MRFFGSIYILTLARGQPVNQIECDENASMMNGCQLLDYDAVWITANCSTGFILTSSGTCVQPCPTGQYLFGTECVDCPANCDACYGPHEFQCSRCSAQYSLNFQGFCSLDCETPSGLFGLPQDGDTLNSCSTCDSSCANCFHEYETACTSCPDGIPGSTFSLKVLAYAAGRTGAGYCTKDPGVDYSNYYRQYPKDRLLVQCPSGCAKCDDRFKCTQCLTGYTIYPPVDSGAGYATCYRSS